MPKKITGTKRKKKDPNRPKNAPSAYILYCKAMRPTAVEKNPDLGFIEINRVLGKMWKAEKDDVKAQYQKESAELKIEATKARAKYDEDHPPQSSDDEDDEPAPKRRAKKDPNKPKNPTSAYFYYQKAIRSEVKAEDPTASAKDIVRKVAFRWRALTDEEKEPFNELAVKDRVRYRTERDAYELKKAEEAMKAEAESDSGSEEESGSSSEDESSSDEDSD